MGAGWEGGGLDERAGGSLARAAAVPDGQQGGCARHRQRLAEPEPPPRRLGRWEKRAASRQALGLPPYERGCVAVHASARANQTCCASATQIPRRCLAPSTACRIHCRRVKEHIMPSKQPSGTALGVRPYVSHTGAFTTGSDSPRAFLERCLEVIAAQEDAVGAFVTLNIAGARAAADASTARWQSGATLSPIDGMPVGIKDI